MDFAKYAALAADPSAIPVSFPPAVEEALDRALRVGPLRPYERRSLCGIHWRDADRVINALDDGLRPYGLRIVVEESMQQDVYVYIAITRVDQ